MVTLWSIAMDTEYLRDWTIGIYILSNFLEEEFAKNSITAMFWNYFVLRFYMLFYHGIPGVDGKGRSMVKEIRIFLHE